MSKRQVTRLQPFSLNAFVIIRAHQKSKVQSVNTCFLYTKVNMKENTLASWNSVLPRSLKRCRKIIRVKKSKRMDIWDRHLSLSTIWSGSVGMEMGLQLIHQSQRISSTPTSGMPCGGTVGGESLINTPQEAWGWCSYPKALFPGALQELYHLKRHPLLQNCCDATNQSAVLTLTFQLEWTQQV